MLTVGCGFVKVKVFYTDSSIILDVVYGKPFITFIVGGPYGWTCGRANVTRDTPGMSPVRIQAVQIKAIGGYLLLRTHIADVTRM